MSLKFELVDGLLGSSVTYVTQGIDILNDVSRVLVSVFRRKMINFTLERLIWQFHNR